MRITSITNFNDSKIRTTLNKSKSTAITSNKVVTPSFTATYGEACQNFVKAIDAAKRIDVRQGPKTNYENLNEIFRNLLFATVNLKEHKDRVYNTSDALDTCYFQYLYSQCNLSQVFDSAIQGKNELLTTYNNSRRELVVNAETPNNEYIEVYKYEFPARITRGIYRRLFCDGYDSRFLTGGIAFAYSKNGKRSEIRFAAFGPDWGDIGFHNSAKHSKNELLLGYEYYKYNLSDGRAVNDGTVYRKDYVYGPEF